VAWIPGCMPILCCSLQRRLQYLFIERSVSEGDAM
jgi:hypothetical protein